MPGWERQGLPGLNDLGGSIQHFRSAIFRLGETRFLLIFVLGVAFGVALC